METIRRRVDRFDNVIPLEILHRLYRHRCFRFHVRKTKRLRTVCPFFCIVLISCIFICGRVARSSRNIDDLRMDLRIDYKMALDMTYGMLVLEMIHRVIVCIFEVRATLLKSGVEDRLTEIEKYCRHFGCSMV